MTFPISNNDFSLTSLSARASRKFLLALILSLTASLVIGAFNTFVSTVLLPIVAEQLTMSSATLPSTAWINLLLRLSKSASRLGVLISSDAIWIESAKVVTIVPASH